MDSTRPACNTHEVEVWIRDRETSRVVRSYDLEYPEVHEGEVLEICLDDQLIASVEYEEETED